MTSSIARRYLAALTRRAANDRFVDGGEGRPLRDDTAAGEGCEKSRPYALDEFSGEFAQDWAAFITATAQP